MLCFVWGAFFSVRVFYARNFLGRRQGAWQGRESVICASARQSIHYPCSLSCLPPTHSHPHHSIPRGTGSDGGWVVPPLMGTPHARALLSRLPDAAPPPCQLWQPKGDHNHEHKEHCADGICGAAAKYDKYNTHMGMPGH